jgi:hypothetical protein
MTRCNDDTWLGRHVNTRPPLIRAGALGAIVGGALRVAAAFAPTLIASDSLRESLYVVIDVCLAAGLLAFYSGRSADVGRLDTAGLVLALGGIVAVRANRLISTIDLYPIGALAIACGVVGLSVSAWRVKRIRGWMPAVFALSTVVGMFGTVVQGAGVLFVWSGVLFGVAFAGLGVETWTESISAR